MIKRNLPLMITIGVFVLGYLYCLTQFPGFASTRVICNILTDNAFLGIIAVGMTFVILSGGIDLSVGSVIAFTGVFLAKVIGDFGLSPLLAFPLVLVMGCAFGAFMGLLIDALKIPAFIITLYKSELAPESPRQKASLIPFQRHRSKAYRQLPLRR